jgi:hypothetical protein
MEGIWNFKFLFSFNVCPRGYLLFDYEEFQLALKDSARAREEAKLTIQTAEEATKLTRKSLWWTRVSVIIATVVGLMQIIVTFVRP